MQYPKFITKTLIDHIYTRYKNFDKSYIYKVPHILQKIYLNYKKKDEALTKVNDLLDTYTCYKISIW